MNLCPAHSFSRLPRTQNYFDTFVFSLTVLAPVTLLGLSIVLFCSVMFILMLYQPYPSVFIDYLSSVLTPLYLMVFFFVYR